MTDILLYLALFFLGLLVISVISEFRSARQFQKELDKQNQEILFSDCDRTEFFQPKKFFQLEDDTHIPKAKEFPFDRYSNNEDYFMKE